MDAARRARWRDHAGWRRRPRWDDLAGSGRRGRPAAGTELACYRVGVDVEDPDGRFLAAAGLSPDGALLVRPDGFVGWRSPTAAGAPDLAAVLADLIGRG